MCLFLYICLSIVYMFSFLYIFVYHMKLVFVRFCYWAGIIGCPFKHNKSSWRHNRPPGFRNELQEGQKPRVWRPKRTSSLVPPRVALVLFRTVFNGWCTARRFQVKEAKCLLGCDPGSRQGCHDSIEHYAHCPVVKHFAMHSLNIPQSCVGGLFNFLCMKPVDDEVLTLQLLLAFAMYRATNCWRFARPQAAKNAMHEFLLRYVHQGASTMTSAQRVVHKYLSLRRTQRRVA